MSDEIITLSGKMKSGPEYVEEGYTVCVQEQGDLGGTTHVSYHAGTVDEAVAAALAGTRSDWGFDEESDTELHVLAVLKGDVEVVSWDDQGV